MQQEKASSSDAGETSAKMMTTVVKSRTIKYLLCSDLFKDGSLQIVLVSMAAPNFANTQMVVGVNHKLRRWWEDIKGDHTEEVAQLLGGLTFLIYVAADRYLIKTLLNFWEPARAVFKFRDCKMTPTIEEIGGFTDLPYKGRSMIPPHRVTPKKFLKNLGLRNNQKLACLDFEWVSIKFFYARFDHKDAYKSYSGEFSCSAAKWETYRVNAFAIALLGLWYSLGQTEI